MHEAGVKCGKINTHKQVMIGFSFPSLWLRKWREFFQPTTAQNKTKPFNANESYLQDSNENHSSVHVTNKQNKKHTHTQEEWEVSDLTTVARFPHGPFHNASLSYQPCSKNGEHEWSFESQNMGVIINVRGCAEVLPQ